MSLLEALPLELFREVSSYLHFLDKKALSIASKSCKAMTGDLKCPDLLTWFIYLWRSPAEHHGPLAQKCEVFGELIYNLQCYHNSRGIRRLKVSNIAFEGLFS